MWQRRTAEAAILAFGCFVGYRGLSAIMFDEPLSLLGCLVGAIATGLLFFRFEKHATLGFGIRMMAGETGLSPKAKNPWFFHIPIFALLNVLLGFLITIGFSDYFVQRSLDFEEDWLLLAVLFACPAIALAKVAKKNARSVVEKSKSSAADSGR